VFGNWLASSLNFSPSSFASPSFNGFAVSYDLCVYKKYKQLRNKIKGSLGLYTANFLLSPYEKIQVSPTYFTINFLEA
jgi:hypothetical protein